MRRQLAKASGGLKTITTSETVYRKLSGKAHLHACTTCRSVYVCNCAAAAVNGRCQRDMTEGRLGRASWERSRDPQDCCVNNTEQVVDNDMLIRYALAGPGPWFQCKQCFRAHPKPPTERTTP